MHAVVQPDVPAEVLAVLDEEPRFLRDLVRIGDEAAPLACRDVFSSVEGVAASQSICSRKDSVTTCPHRLTSVLHDWQSQPSQTGHIGKVSKEVDRENRRRFLRNDTLHRFLSNA